jgi:phage baseplate assembly protein W
MPKVFSPEDGNLSSNIRVVKTRKYSDIDLTLSARTDEFGFLNGDGDILKKLDAAAVKQSIKNLLLTNHHEKPYRPKFGGNLGNRLFDLMDASTSDQIIDDIKIAIERYEPRAKITGLKVVASPDYNYLSVIIEFRVVQTGFVDVLRVGVTEQIGTIAFVPPVTPDPIFDEILLSEDSNRLLTLGGDLIGIDIALIGLLTQAGEPILTQTGNNQLL